MQHCPNERFRLVRGLLDIQGIKAGMYAREPDWSSIIWQLTRFEDDITPYVKLPRTPVTDLISHVEEVQERWSRMSQMERIIYEAKGPMLRALDSLEDEFIDRAFSAVVACECE